jgi:hypothetical protein
VTEGRGQGWGHGQMRIRTRELKAVDATRQSHPLGELVCERDDPQEIRSIGRGASRGPYTHGRITLGRDR